MDYFKAAWKFTTNKFGIKCRFTAFYLFFLLIAFLLAFILPISILLTLPFIVLPFTFSYLGCISLINYNKEISILTFFIFYKKYFSPEFKGVFRGLLGFLKMILVEVIISIIVGLLFYYLYCAKQPGFAVILQQIESAKTTEAMDIAMNELINFKPFVDTIIITGEISLGIGSLIFINHMMLQSELVIHIMNSKIVPPIKFLRPVYNRMCQIRRKQFLKIYLLSTSFIYFLFAVGIGGFFVLSNFVFHLETNQALAIGLAAAFILNFFFLPYFVDFLICINAASTEDYNQAIFDCSKKAINDARRKNLLTEEQIEQLENDLFEGTKKFIVSDENIENEEDKDKK